MIVLWVFALLFGVYACLLLMCISGWLMLPEQRAPIPVPRKKVTVVVAARNEEAHIEQLLNDLLRQDYPPALREYLIVDDFSSDQTAQRILPFASHGVRLIRMADFLGHDKELHGSKKIALETAIGQATGEIIVVTDADCRLLPGWLSAMVAAVEETDSDMAVGPVTFAASSAWVQRYQALENIGLVAMGAALLAWRFPLMCNAANLAFCKHAFEAVGGYAGTHHTSSGDDVFLMQKIWQRRPGSVRFVKDRRAVVTTSVQPSWSALLEQRLRWASKWSKYADWRIQGLAFSLWSLHLMFWFVPVWAVSTGEGGRLWITALSIKLLLDGTFLALVVNFFRRLEWLRLFLISVIVQSILIVCVGILVHRKKIRWKGRMVQ